MYYSFVTLPLLEIIIIASFEIISTVINDGEDLLKIYNGGS